MQTLKTTICVIGAGPSGATASIFLSKKKIHHILLDAATFPRDKTCGDGLDVRSIRALNLIDKNLLKKETEITGRIKPINGCRIITGKGKYLHFEYVNSEHKLPFFATSKRVDFDALLHEQINTTYCNFLQKTKAITVVKTNDGWQIEADNNGEKITIFANCMVGADGDHSMVLKHVGNRLVNKHHYAGGLRQYWKNIADLHENNLYELYFPKKFPLGYFWIFPLHNGYCNVGLGIQSNIIADKKLNMKEIFNDIIKNDPYIQHRFKQAEPVETIKGWGLPLASLRRKCIGDGWILIGDAASMISPTTGEGIGTGMLSGYIAAQFLEKAVKQNNFTELTFKNFEVEVYKRINDDITVHTFFEKFPFLYNWALDYLLPLPYFKKLFLKRASQWYDTAYHKDLNITLE